MSYTNHTTHYELPQWVRDDKPTFLSDMNGAFDKIDRALHDNANGITDMEAEVQRVEGVVDGFGDRLDTAETKISALETSQGQLEQGIQHNAGDINTINSLIGNGQPTTQDKTIIGAINELAAEITGDPRVDALVEEVGNTPLETTADTLTAAINEVNTKATNAGTVANSADQRSTANANTIGAGTLDTQAQTLIGAINEVNAKPSGGDTVVVTPTLQSGTKVADISVNGVNKSIYAPTGGGGGLTFLQSFTGSITENLAAIKTYLDNYNHDKVGLYLVPDVGNWVTSEEVTNVNPVLVYSGKHSNNYCFSGTLDCSASNPFVVTYSLSTGGTIVESYISANGSGAQLLTSAYSSYTWRLFKV